MDAQQQTDEALMNRLACGESKVLDVLLHRHATPVLTFIQRMIGRRHRAEDLFQEVFMAVWLKRGQYDASRPFRPWLLAIAVNKCRAELRQWQLGSIYEQELPADCPVASDPSPVETAIGTETATLVAAAVAVLPERQRSIVVLRIWNGLPYAEIAEAMGLSESTVRVQMFRGLKTMRKFLEPRMKNIS
jgi:RNA polymerase sigma-70 factor, ECF subfamily